MKTILIRGAGDLASGCAVQLHKEGWRILMTELPQPLCVRWQVSFSPAVYAGCCQVAGIQAQFVNSPEEWSNLAAATVGVTTLPYPQLLEAVRPEAVVDGIMAKKNLGLHISDAPQVIALGPGFWAGRDCQAVIETQRGPDLGRIILDGPAAADTGIPGLIAGEDRRRVLRCKANGRFQPCLAIGDRVRAGETVAQVGDEKIYAQITGVIRGLLPAGTQVTSDMKCGDVDPRGKVELCFQVSDKAMQVGNGAAQALKLLRENTAR